MGREVRSVWEELSKGKMIKIHCIKDFNDEMTKK